MKTALFYHINSGKVLGRKTPARYGNYGTNKRETYIHRESNWLVILLGTRWVKSSKKESLTRLSPSFSFRLCLGLVGIHGLLS